MAESGDKYFLRAFKSSDYDEYASWWEKSGNNPPPISSIPLMGLVVGDMKAVGFLVMTEVDFSVITWWQANPSNKFGESRKAIKKLFQGLCEASLLARKNKVFCYTNNRAIIRLLESLHFNNYDGHLIWEQSNDE